ncbi:hypothetical protein ACWCQK_38115 [Streptomyces sp. NPDC002306]
MAQPRADTPRVECAPPRPLNFWQLLLAVGRLLVVQGRGESMYS